MTAPPRTSIPRGIVQIARGRPAGLAEFPATPQGFLTSLAPLVAFPLVGTLLFLSRGGGAAAIADFLATLSVLLAPAVLSFEFARLWRREAAWLRFATAFNWCQWLLPVVGSILLLVLGILLQVGLSQDTAAGLLVLGLSTYGLWLHWFLARHALDLSRLRATLLVIGVNLATALLVLLPRLLLLQRS